MNIKKIGLTALAGSLVASTAFAGTMTMSGGAKFSYTTKDGSALEGVQTGSHFGLDQELSAVGSAELDNGMTVSVTHLLDSTGSSSSTSTLTLDMGDMGKLSYSDTDASGGLHSLDDITPTAYEEVSNGVALDVQAGMSTGQGFAYSNTFAGASVGIQYSDNQGAAIGTDGTTSSSAGASSSSSIGITYPVGDTGLTIYGGVGTEGQADSTEIDHTTIGAKYAFGPVTVGYQVNDEDNSAADNTVEADEDLETTAYSLSFSVNENLSVSYGENTTTSTATGAVDQDYEGMSIAYSMGGITISAYDHEGTSMSNVQDTNTEAQEILVSFAF